MSMELEELAAILGRDMGRSVFIERRARTMILQGSLRNAGLPTDMPVVIRLEDMIDNLCEEAWRDWQKKRDAARIKWHEPRQRSASAHGSEVHITTKPPSTLASFLHEQERPHDHVWGDGVGNETDTCQRCGKPE